ncbi:hypothetical protein [Rheinheimera sp.]|uniref:hypothetical protein n=1 Tax=Rheinheimera sp. TaxID=1869214 RepID=UPI0027B98423|nr:hypothetical protein [Rheinheimera sp.]
MHNGPYKKLQEHSSNNSTLLVCSDIFGINPALQAFFKDWRGELRLLSPYTKQQHFSDDEKAYQYFQQQGGLDSYRQKLRQILQQLAIAQQTKPQKVIAVGFSAGAAALWCELGCGPAHKLDGEPEQKLTSSAAAKRQTAMIQQAFCFYGGQIRHFAELNPGCQTELIWAQERHFDVKALAKALSGKANVSSRHCAYSHGFINPKSGGYHKQGAAYYQRWLMSKLLGGKAA